MIAALACGPALAQAQGTGANNPRVSALVDDLRYGIYCAVDPLREDPAAGTASGSINIVPEVPTIRFEQVTVPAHPALGFGVVLRLMPGLDLNGVAVQVTHPPFRGIYGQRAIREDGLQIEQWTTELEGDSYSLIGFTFDHAYEEVPGPWTFSATADGQEIFHIAFEVVPGAALPDIPLACLGGALS